MIDSIFTAVQHPFFLRSLLAVGVLTIIFPLYGNIVLVRQEANIAHTFAHLWLLWVALGLWFERPVERAIFGSVLATVGLLYRLWLDESSNHVAHNEIGAQFGLVGAILIVSQMSWYKADITSYLFGDILLLGSFDLYSIIIIALITGVCYLVWWKSWYATALDRTLAISKGIWVRVSYLVYLVALWLLIGGAMKIIGVLLVSAFLILPSNIWKLIATSQPKRVYISILVGVCSSMFALFLSWHLDMPSWATIIACLLLFYAVTVFFSKWITRRP